MSEDKYKNTRRRGDWLYVIVTLISVWVFYELKEAAMPLLMVTLPMMLAHASFQSHTANKRGDK